MSRFYATEKLGPKRALTPEGFLICEDVPLARTGSQLYRVDEVYDEVPKGLRPGDPIRVYREPEEVFRPETIASFQGKPVVDEHPTKDGKRVDVTPETWNKLAKGVVLNPRRGEGVDDDLLLGDILVTDRDAIDAILAGKRELSCGYDAEYVENGGKMEQRFILGNHVALVEDGRCGPRCAIGDHGTIITDERKDVMSKTKAGDAGWFRNLLRNAKKVGDEELDPMANKAAEELHGSKEGGEEETKEDEEVGDHQHVHVHNHNGFDGIEEHPHIKALHDRIADLEAKVNGFGEREEEFKKKSDAYDKMHSDWTKHRRDSDSDWKTRDEGAAEKPDKEIEGAIKMEAPPGTGDATKMHDSATLSESFQRTVALSEIIAPGIRKPAFDGAAKPAETVSSIHKLRCSALQLAHNDPKGRGFIEDVLGGAEFDLDKMGHGEVKQLFQSVGAMKRAANNSGGDVQRRAVGDSAAPASGGLLPVGSVKSIKDLQARHAKFWETH